MNLFKTSSLMLALSLLATVSVSAVDNMDVKAENQEVHAMANDMESAEEKIDQAKETAEYEARAIENQLKLIKEEIDQADKTAQHEARAINNDMVSAEEKIDQAEEKSEALEEQLEDAETDDEDESMDDAKDHTGAIDAPHKSMNDDAASKKLDDEINNLLKQIAESQEKGKSDSTDIE